MSFSERLKPFLTDRPLNLKQNEPPRRGAEGYQRKRDIVNSKELKPYPSQAN
jgi:hypothetical protein